MQDYYNIIPTFDVGGILSKILIKGGARKAQNYANLLSKEMPQLSKLLTKLAQSQKGGPKLSESESKKLIELAQQYRRNNIHYQNRRIKINEQLRAKTPKPVTPTQEVTPKPVTPTLTSRYQQVKNWINNHPKTVVGGALFLGSGTGRDVLSKAGDIYSARPFTSSPTTDQQIVTINGTDIPIVKSSNGKFIPVQTQSADSSSVKVGDDIDALINSARKDTTTQATSQIYDQQAINDLFEDDQWY